MAERPDEIGHRGSVVALFLDVVRGLRCRPARKIAPGTIYGYEDADRTLFRVTACWILDAWDAWKANDASHCDGLQGGSVHGRWISIAINNQTQFYSFTYTSYGISLPWIQEGWRGALG